MSATEQQQTMTPEEHLRWVTARRDELYAETVRQKETIRDLKAQLETARKDALEEAAEICRKAKVRAAPHIGYVKASHLEAAIRALARDEGKGVK